VYLRDREDVWNARRNKEEEPEPVRLGDNKSAKLIPEVWVDSEELIKCHKPTSLKFTKVQIPYNIKSLNGSCLLKESAVT